MRTIDLFSGCGGMSLGFQNAGFDILCAVDKWDKAVEVYASNFNHPIHKLDLSDDIAVELIKSYKPDLIIGGPPCQDFSSAGKRADTGSRADLTLDFASIVSRVRPKYFVMENVERITKSAHLVQVKKILHESGYSFCETVLLASLCNVPQNRKRYFLIGSLSPIDAALAESFEAHQTKDKMTVYDYLGDSLGLECYYRHPRTYARRAIFSIHEPSPTVRGVNRPVPATYKKHKNDACDVTDELRALTTIERSYLQTFPSDFIFTGTKTNLEQMIGNAVPVNLARYIADRLKEYIERGF